MMTAETESVTNESEDNNPYPKYEGSKTIETFKKNLKQINTFSDLQIHLKSLFNAMNVDTDYQSKFKSGQIFSGIFCVTKNVLQIKGSEGAKARAEFVKKLEKEDITIKTFLLNLVSLAYSNKKRTAVIARAVIFKILNVTDRIKTTHERFTQQIPSDMHTDVAATKLLLQNAIEKYFLYALLIKLSPNTTLKKMSYELKTTQVIEKPLKVDAQKENEKFQTYESQKNIWLENSPASEKKSIEEQLGELETDLKTKTTVNLAQLTSIFKNIEEPTLEDLKEYGFCLDSMPIFGRTLF